MYDFISKILHSDYELLFIDSPQSPAKYSKLENEVYYHRQLINFLAEGRTFGGNYFEDLKNRTGKTHYS